MSLLVEAFEDLATTLAFGGTEGGHPRMFNDNDNATVVTLVRTGVDFMRSEGLTDDEIAAQVPMMAVQAVKFWFSPASSRAA